MARVTEGIVPLDGNITTEGNEIQAEDVQAAKKDDRNTVNLVATEVSAYLMAKATELAPTSDGYLIKDLVSNLRTFAGILDMKVK